MKCLKEEEIPNCEVFCDNNAIFIKTKEAKLSQNKYKKKKIKAR